MTSSRAMIPTSRCSASSTGRLLIRWSTISCRTRVSARRDVLGLDAGSTHRLTAEAIADTTVRLVKRRSLETAAGSNVRVAHTLWTMTASDLRHAEDHMLLLGRKTAMEKVATFLLEMDRRLAKAGMMALPMWRPDIGDYLGLTLETVSRALSQLSGQGVLVFSSARQIVLRNRQRLADMDA
ncbi:helix-turn-helix domain-containing protein [Bradyrhizobium sp. AZCC 1610]|uniref:helix-turn-helix domain-containing protein n=1 Tax=Bradyrhizobium sp. AZCC 1610 TaxID=3117020 RepID=UPI002FF1E7BF